MAGNGQVSRPSKTGPGVAARERAVCAGAREPAQFHPCGRSLPRATPLLPGARSVASRSVQSAVGAEEPWRREARAATRRKATAVWVMLAAQMAVKATTAAVELARGRLVRWPRDLLGQHRPLPHLGPVGKTPWRWLRGSGQQPERQDDRCSTCILSEWP